MARASPSRRARSRAGVASAPVPQARFSPTARRRPPAGSRRRGCASAGVEPSRPVVGEVLVGDHVVARAPSAARCRRGLGVSGGRPRSARSPLSRQSVVAATAARFVGGGRSVGVGAGARRRRRRRGGSAPARGASGRSGRPGDSSRRRSRAPGVGVAAPPRRPAVIADARRPDAAPGGRRRWRAAPPASRSRRAPRRPATAGSSAERVMPTTYRPARAADLSPGFGSAAVDVGAASPAAGAELVERLDHLGIELRARRRARISLGGVLDAERLLVRALVDEHVEDVGDVRRAAPRAGCRRPRARRGSRSPSQRSWWERAMLSATSSSSESPSASTRAPASAWVLTTSYSAARQPARLEQDRVRDGDLADVVQRRGVADVR